MRGEKKKMFKLTVQANEIGSNLKRVNYRRELYYTQNKEKAIPDVLYCKMLCDSKQINDYISIGISTGSN